jgi:acyl-coenzyme A thioesterase PaaI-like protein
MAVNINMNFYNSANVGDKLVGEAEKVKGGKRVGFFRLRVWKEGGEELVAEGTAIVYGKGEKIIT